VRYAILSDIHGNYDALQAVLKEIRDLSIDHAVCLGDIVGYGPQPLECIQALQRLNATVVSGNHDFAVCEKIDISTFNVYARESTLWTRDVLDSDALGFLSQLPLVHELDGFTAVHGTLHSPELFDYIQSCYEASMTLDVMQQELCFIGHSHVPVGFVQDDFIGYITGQVIPLERGQKMVVNVGSVGQPRDQDPRACFVVLDTSENQVRYHRVRYDIDATISKIDAVGLPRPLGERLLVGR